MRGPCISCAALPKCKKATPEMVLLLEGCGLYEEVAEPITNARIRAVDLFGPDSVTKIKRKVDMEIIGQRKYLRSIAVACGAVSQGKSFPMKAEDLVTAIQGVTDDNGTPRFSGIAQMDDDTLKALNAEIKNGATPAPAKKEVKKEAAEKEAAPVVKKPRKKRTPKPVPETVEAAAEAGNEKDAPRRKPAARRPSRKAAPTTEVSSNGASGGTDLTLLLEMVKTIGIMVEKQGAEQASSMQEATDLNERLLLIEQHLCWVYNADAEPGNEISSLTEVDWT
jgi:hypothetical protein